MISALQFHELTLEMPSRVWAAIGTKARKPKFEYPAIQIVQFESQALSLGVEVHRINGVAVPIFNPAKTVVDCFRFRRHFGVGVALEGLHSVMKSEKANPAEIHSIRAGDAYLGPFWALH